VPVRNGPTVRGGVASRRPGRSAGFGANASLGPRLGLTLSGIRYEDPATSNQMEVRSGLHLGGSVAKDLGGHFAASRSGQAGAALSGWRAVGRQADRAC
jgi:hypothetical protein